MQAAAINLLVDKGGFHPTAAFAVAEVIDMSVGGSQFVTVPILDARLQALEARVMGEVKTLEALVEAKFQRLHKYMVFWFITIAFGQSMLPKLAPLIEQWLKVVS